MSIPPPFDRPCDEMSTILWWSVLSALVDSFGASCNEANSQSAHLYANAFCKDVVRVFIADYGSESTSELRSSGEMEIKSNDFRVPLSCFNRRL